MLPPTLKSDIAGSRDRRPAARHHRRLGSVAGVADAASQRGSRSRADPGVPVAAVRRAAANSISWSPCIAQRQFDAVSFTSAAAVLATLTRASELGISDELLAGAAVRCARDVRRAVDRRPLTRLGMPTSVTGAYAVGRRWLVTSPRNCRDCAPDTVRAAGHRDRGPRQLRHGGRGGQVGVAVGDGDAASTGAPARPVVSRETLLRVASGPRHQHPRGGHRRAAAANRAGRQNTSSPQWSNAATGWRSTT